MKTISITIILIISLLHNLFSQTKPVDISISNSQFFSVYLSDFYSNVGKISFNTTLNDHNEPSWNIKLKITIQGNSVLLQTKPGFTPSQPITLFPGITNFVSGGILSEYFSPDNLLCTGISTTEFQNNAKIPEGNYQISVEALDFHSGKPLSKIAFSSFVSALGTPPIPIFPEDNSILQPITTPIINFNWQIADPILSQPGLLVKYIIYLYEITDPNLNSEEALLQNSINPVYISEPQMNTFFSINPLEINLIQGNKYLYRIKAIEESGYELFQNNGLSIPYSFYYGTPTNGTINLLTPVNNYAMLKNDVPIFSWNKASNALAGNNVEYVLQIAEDFNVSNPTIESGNIFLETTVPAPLSGNEIFYISNNELTPLKAYIWQVKAYSDNTEIAKSSIFHFTGPPLFEKFVAANIDIYISSVQNPDLNSFTGTGTVQLSEGQPSQNLVFNDIKLFQNSGLYFMTEGEIIGKIDDLQLIGLSSVNSLNPEANFVTDSFKIEPYELKIKGKVEIPFPHPTETDSLIKLTTEKSWLNFNNRKIYGNLPLNPLNTKLLSPSDFFIETNSQSYIILTGSQYILNANGKILKPLPNSSDTTSFYFNNQDNLLRINSLSSDNSSLQLSREHNFQLFSNQAIIDLDNTFSFFENDSIPMWKGIILQNPKILLPSINSAGAIFSLEEEVQILLTDLAKPAVIEASGLRFETTISSFSTTTYINSFPAEINKCYIEVSPETNFNCNIESIIKFPVLSLEENFSIITNLKDDGVSSVDFADTSIIKTFLFNPENEDSKIEITVNSAEFFNNNCLQMNVDIEWPAINLNLQNLPLFTIYGNYDIGFLQPSGTINPPEQALAQINNYTIQCLSVGCGMSQGKYALGIDAAISMGDDISGPNGPPKINLYSVWENPLLQNEYNSSSSAFFITQDTTNSSVLTDEINTEIQEIENLILSIIQNSSETSNVTFSSNQTNSTNSNITLFTDSVLNVDNQNQDLNFFFAKLEVSVPESFSNNFNTIKNFCLNLKTNQQNAIGDNLNNLLQIAANQFLQNYIVQLDTFILEKTR
ncbi:MAG: hypothetical protein JXR58_12025, partial [Bacteroidales bacterium]|nr:hypothetical protein [Bacteroidales bacterium]